MQPDSPENHFRRFQRDGNPQALAAVFDALAPELVLVAAHLAGGDVAEDLVQATFLDAIEQRARWDERRPLAPWLVGILANHVRQSKRERHRVPDPQRLPAREAEEPGDAAAAAEVAAEVHRAVEALPPPYRRVLSLRLVHGLELQQIAHSLGVPLGTVKTQVHRGTALLRRALPAGLAGAFAALLLPGRGLAAVRAVVMTQAKGAAAAATGAGVLFGAVAMKKIGFAVALVLLLLGGWWAATSSPSTAIPRVPASAAAAAATATAPPPSVSPSADALPAAVREAVATTGSVELEVVWQRDGAPAAQIPMRLSARDGVHAIRAVTTDDAGMARWPDIAPGPYLVYSVHAAPIGAPVERVDVAAGAPTRRRLVLDGDLDLHVVVVDRDDRPVAGAAVWALSTQFGYGEQSYRALGTTGNDGTFAFRGWPLHSIWARRAGSEPSQPLVLDDTPGRREERLRLGGAGSILRGRVVDPDGNAVAHALVLAVQDESALLHEFAPELRSASDARGQFAFDELFAGERAVLAFAPGFARAEVRVALSPAEPAVVELRLRKGATIEGRVTDATGRPAAGATVRAIEARGLFGIGSCAELEPAFADVGDDGRYRLPALVPTQVHAHVARGNDQELVSVDRTFDLRDGEAVVWDCVLATGGAIAGRVVDAKEQPLAGWFVEVNGQPTTSDGSRSVQTDRDGRFRLAGLPDRTFAVMVFDAKARGAARWVCHAHAENVRPPAESLLLRVADRPGESASIAGTIRWPADTPRTKVTLSLYPKGELAPHGPFAVPSEQLAPGDEAFRIGPLPPGVYDLLCDTEHRGRLAVRDLQLAAAATREVTFDLAAQQPLRVRLRHPDGSAVTTARVLVEGDCDRSPCTETQPGEYTSPPRAAGPCMVRACGPGFAMEAFAVDAGAAPVEHVVAAGTTVELRVRPPGEPRQKWVAGLMVTVCDAAGTEVLSDMMQVDDKEVFVLRIGLAAGSYTVRMQAFVDGAATVPLTVPAPRAEPLVVDVSLQKK